MANRSYLTVTTSNNIYPSFERPGVTSSGEVVACDVNAIPLLWLAMFRVEDLRQEIFSVDSQSLLAEAPITSVERAILQLHRAIPSLNSVFTVEGPLDAHAQLLSDALSADIGANVTIQWDEIECLFEQEGEFQALVRGALRGLDARPSSEMKNCLSKLADLRLGSRFPSEKMYLEKLPYSDDDQWNFTRILGAGNCGSLGYGRNVPWEREDADYGFTITTPR
jgi:hypothetical protein